MSSPQLALNAAAAQQPLNRLPRLQGARESLLAISRAAEGQDKIIFVNCIEGDNAHQKPNGDIQFRYTVLVTGG